MPDTYLAVPAGHSATIATSKKVSTYRGPNDSDQIDEFDELGVTLTDRIDVPMDVYEVDSAVDLGNLERTTDITDGGWAVLVWQYHDEDWRWFVRVFRGNRPFGDLVLLADGDISIPGHEVQVGVGEVIGSARRALYHLSAINSES